MSKFNAMRYLLTLLLITSVSLFSGCTKEQGCTDITACNFSSSAEEDDGSCYLPGEECDDGNDSTILDQYTNTCHCEGVDIGLGCTDYTACNYSASANTDDGSCYFIGDSCDDGDSATLNDSWSNSCLCTGELLGCTSSTPCNYNSEADIDDGSCYFIGDSCDDGDSATLNDSWSNTCVCEGDICGGDLSYDGYDYSTVLIGDQCWFSENCRYLPEVFSDFALSEIDPRYFVYGYYGTNVEAAKATSNYETYGVLYNWPAVMTEDICPNGWHIPSVADFTVLTDFLGGEGVAGGKMKEAGYDYWDSPNEGATNSSGFTGLPGGGRFSGNANQGEFSNEGDRGFWWSSTESNTSYAWRRILITTTEAIAGSSPSSNKSLGYSARCVRN